MLDEAVAEVIKRLVSNKKFADKMSGDNIYKALIFFDKLYEKMSETEKRAFYEKLIKEVQVYEERQPNGQWLKSIEFKLPILGGDMKLSLDNSYNVETVVQLSKGNINRDRSERKSAVKAGDIGMISGYSKGNKVPEITNVKIDFSLENLDLSELKGR
jgi:site-specific DNA recombinase